MEEPSGHPRRPEATIVDDEAEIGGKEVDLGFRTVFEKFSKIHFSAHGLGRPTWESRRPKGPQIRTKIAVFTTLCRERASGANQTR